MMIVAYFVTKFGEPKKRVFSRETAQCYFTETGARTAKNGTWFSYHATLEEAQAKYMQHCNERMKNRMLDRKRDAAEELYDALRAIIDSNLLTNKYLTAIADKALRKAETSQ